MFFNIEKAKEAQKILGKLALIEPIDVDSIDVVVGLDVSYRNSNAVAAAVAYSVYEKKIVDFDVAFQLVKIPYIPGLLAFREAPVMFLALKKLVTRIKRVNVIMINGHGLAHPRKCGIATHIGVVMNMPTIGVAKRLLYGKIISIGDNLAIAVEDAIVGYVVNRKGHRIYISVGHKITAEDALKIALSLWDKNSLFPEPLRLADSISREYAYRIFSSK